jgi:hypothetical protein
VEISSCRVEKSGRCAVPLSFPSSSDSANPVFWLDLTPDDPAIYHPQRWDRMKFVLEGSFDQPGKKRNSKTMGSDEIRA